MRCEEADVLLLCKRNFDPKKFPNYYEAIRDYQATWANCPKEHLTENMVLRTMIVPACKKYFKPYDWEQVLEKIYEKDSPWSFVPKENWMSHILTSQLSLLRVKRDGVYLIEDMKDYEN